MPTNSRGMPEKLIGTPWTMEKRVESTAAAGNQPGVALVGPLLPAPPPAHSGYRLSAGPHVVYVPTAATQHPATMISNIPPGVFGVATPLPNFNEQKSRIVCPTGSSSSVSSLSSSPAHSSKRSGPDATTEKVKTTVNGSSQRHPASTAKEQLLHAGNRTRAPEAPKLVARNDGTYSIKAPQATVAAAPAKLPGIADKQAADGKGAADSHAVTVTVTRGTKAHGPALGHSQVLTLGQPRLGQARDRSCSPLAAPGAISSATACIVARSVSRTDSPAVAQPCIAGSDVGMGRPRHSPASQTGALDASRSSLKVVPPPQQFCPKDLRREASAPAAVAVTPALRPSGELRVPPITTAPPKGGSHNKASDSQFSVAELSERSTGATRHAGSQPAVQPTGLPLPGVLTCCGKPFADAAPVAATCRPAVPLVTSSESASFYTAGVPAETLEGRYLVNGLAPASSVPVDYSRGSVRPASVGPVPSASRPTAAYSTVQSGLPEVARPFSAPASVVATRSSQQPSVKASSFGSVLAHHSGTPSRTTTHNSTLSHGLPLEQPPKALLAAHSLAGPAAPRPVGRDMRLLHSKDTTAVPTPPEAATLRPFNQRLKTLANFPLASTQLLSASRARLLASHRTRAGCIVSSAKSQDLLRRSIQKFFNAEVDAILKKHVIPYLSPAVDNMHSNNSDTESQATVANFEGSVASMCYQLLEEAKKMYMPVSSSRTRSATPDVSDGASDTGSITAEKRHPRLIFSHLKRRHSDTDSEASAAATSKKKRGRPPGTAANASRIMRIAEPVKRDASKWNPDRINSDQLFIMGARANKALGLGATRGRLYIKHPEVFKYTGDQDDKQWLFESHLLPATGGKAYMLLVEDVRELADTEEYKSSGSLMLHELKGFTIPDWMQAKVKAQMTAVCADTGLRWRPGNIGTPADVASTSSGGGDDAAVPAAPASGVLDSFKAKQAPAGGSPDPRQSADEEDEKEERGLPFLTSGEVSEGSESDDSEDVAEDDEPPPLSAPFTVTSANAIGER